VAPPQNTVLLQFDARGVVQAQGTPLPFYPAVHAPRDDAIFAPAERLEFRSRRLDEAAAAYRSLTASWDRVVRAAR
jgi:hypothetical protein